MTVSRALGHLTNFTTGHETRTREIGPSRLEYPDQHVEVDNRLAWFLGGLEQRYGAAPLYVHLRRDPEAVAKSFNRRWHHGIMPAFGTGVIAVTKPSGIDGARFYVETVTANIEAFLQGKPNRMTVWLEDAADWFPALWQRVDGQGDLTAALSEFDVRHNATRTAEPEPAG
jgi:hypothetical protein